MKTITQIKKHFSNEEIKILVEVVKGKQDFEVIGEQIKDFYSDEYNEDDLTDKDDDFDWLRNDLLEKLEFDLEIGGVMPIRKTVGQLLVENHWSVQRLAVAINITKEDIIKWEKLNKRYKKLNNK